MSNTLTQNNPYITRFEDMLKPLQSKLSKLEIKLDPIDDDHPHKQQSRLNVLEEISKTKQEIQITEKNLECSKTMKRIRSDKVPKDVEDHNVWNDCWYDEERKLYVTHNKYFMEIPDARDRSHQIQYTKETGDNGVVALSDKVEFRFGYPCVIQKDSKNRDIWFLLTTVTDNMLTKELVSSRLQPLSQENAVLYETESEAWIDVLGTQLPEREYELACEIMPYLVKTPLEILKASAGRPYNQKLFEQQMTQINNTK